MEKTYTIYKFNDEAMDFMLHHKDSIFSYHKVKDFKDFAFPNKVERFELSVKEIWENVSSLGWSVFPMSEYVSEIQKYVDMGLHPVFVQFDTQYNKLRKEYKAFVMKM